MLYLRDRELTIQTKTNVNTCTERCRLLFKTVVVAARMHFQTTKKCRFTTIEPFIMQCCSGHIDSFLTEIPPQGALCSPFFCSIFCKGTWKKVEKMEEAEVVGFGDKDATYKLEAVPLIIRPLIDLYIDISVQSVIFCLQIKVLDDCM